MSTQKTATAETFEVRLQVTASKITDIINMVSDDIKLVGLVPDQQPPVRDLSSVTSSDIAREVLSSHGGKANLDTLRKEFSKRGFTMSTVKPALSAMEKAGEVKPDGTNSWSLT